MTFTIVDPKEVALAAYLETSVAEITCEYDNMYRWRGDSYLVVDDAEADAEATERVVELLDEELNLVPQHLRIYFDRAQYVLDSLSAGRGSILAGYDGCENEIRLDEKNLRPVLEDWYDEGADDDVNEALHELEGLAFYIYQQ